MVSEVVKLTAGDYKIPVTLVYNEGRIEFSFGFNRPLMETIKTMAGSKWHGYDEKPRKIWSVADNQHNRFQLAYLAGKNPYAPYDPEPVILPTIKRMNTSIGRVVELFKHQREMIAFALLRRQCIIAGEMGVGKTAAAIEIMERSGFNDWWYVAPKGVISTIKRELRIWNSFLEIDLLTYDELRARMKNWVDGAVPPKGVIFDECQRVKTPTAQRSQAAVALANGMREHFGQNAYIIEMSGTPAPRSPEDWYNLCEIACPGFLKEGDIHKFRRTLGLIVQKESPITGGVYPHLVTWLDDDKKCAKCGEVAAHTNHLANGDMFGNDNLHDFVASVNEIARLYRRMKGLVLVKMKKDCLDLPEKRYRIIEVKPNKSTLRVAASLTRSSPTVIQALNLLRELSDGFQYTAEKIGTEECPECHGNKTILEPVPIDESCITCKGHNVDECPAHVATQFAEPQPATCPCCKGKGEVNKYARDTTTVACPKDDVLKDLLDEYHDVGRLIVYGGFQATIDKITKLTLSEGWAVIQEDGRGVKAFNPDGTPIPLSEITGADTGDKILTIFQDLLEKYPQVVYVAHPKSGGIGKTLTRAQAAFYYSNSFDGEARAQSEDRHHRPGMDLNFGGVVIDCVHLPSDQKVIDNLKKKRKLELMSLGEVVDSLEKGIANDRN